VVHIVLLSLSRTFSVPFERYDKEGGETVAFFSAWGAETARTIKCNRTFEFAVAPVERSAMHVLQEPATTDEQDVDLVLGGDARAFEGIVRRWQGPLVNMAWRYCRDRGRAEELAQEALVRAWRNLGTWRRESSFSTWLFALAANVYRNDLKRFPTVMVPMEDAPEPAMPAAQHDSLAERSRDELVRRAVLALPPRYREPVVLYYFHEMDVGAAARTLHLPEGTMKARLARARDLLRRRFPHLNEAPAPQPAHLRPREEA
jgi:RNA polymerase sigma-70 factor (ECF subfamily)